MHNHHAKTFWSLLAVVRQADLAKYHYG